MRCLSNTDRLQVLAAILIENTMTIVNARRVAAVTDSAPSMALLLATLRIGVNLHASNCEREIRFEFQRTPRSQITAALDELAVLLSSDFCGGLMTPSACAHFNFIIAQMRWLLLKRVRDGDSRHSACDLSISSVCT